MDPNDRDLLLRYDWFQRPDGYLMRREVGADGRRRTVYFHRALMGLTPGDGLTVDHIDRDTANNRRANLRVVTQQQNTQNVPSRGRTSDFRGVSFCKQTQRWRATAQIGKRHHHIGRYATEEEAAAAALAFRQREMSHAVD